MKLHLRVSLLLVLATFFLFSSCKKETKGKEASVKKEIKKQAKSCDEIHWTYHDKVTGSENWKDLCKGFSDCGGKSQSPINIVVSETKESDKLKYPIFSLGDTKVNILNNGHTIQFNVDPGNYTELDNKKYELLQFHFHSLSEHTIDGKHFPLEVHFVHKYSDTDYAVLGLMYQEGESNQLFKNYLDFFPKNKGEYQSNNTIKLMDLLPKQKDYYHYKGSLTTPPCSEIVNWYVLQEPIMASKIELEKFAELLHNNYRPVMPLNNREVYRTK